MALFNDQKGRWFGKKPNEGTAIFVESDQVQKRKKEAKPKVKSSYADLASVIDLTGNGFLELSDEKGYMDIVQLESSDIYALNESDKTKKIYHFATFLQWYNHDFKIIPFDFPVDTSTQQRHILEKMQQTSKPQYRQFLEKKLQELQFIEQRRTNREFFMFLYADDEYTLQSRTTEVEGQLQAVAPVIRLTDDKKINILYKLNNLNSKNRHTHERG